MSMLHICIWVIFWPLCQKVIKTVAQSLRKICLCINYELKIESDEISQGIRIRKVLRYYAKFARINNAMIFLQRLKQLLNIFRFQIKTNLRYSLPFLLSTYALIKRHFAYFRIFFWLCWLLFFIVSSTGLISSRRKHVAVIFRIYFLMYFLR